MATMDRHFKEDMTLEEASDVLRKCFAEVSLDCGSGEKRNPINERDGVYTEWFVSLLTNNAFAFQHSLRCARVLSWACPTLRCG